MMTNITQLTREQLLEEKERLFTEIIHIYHDKRRKQSEPQPDGVDKLRKQILRINLLLEDPSQDGGSDPEDQQ